MLSCIRPCLTHGVVSHFSCLLSKPWKYFTLRPALTSFDARKLSTVNRWPHNARAPLKSRQERTSTLSLMSFLSRGEIKWIEARYFHLYFSLSFSFYTSCRTALDKSCNQCFLNAINIRRVDWFYWVWLDARVFFRFLHFFRNDFIENLTTSVLLLETSPRRTTMRPDEKRMRRRRKRKRRRHYSPLTNHLEWLPSSFR